VSLFDQRAFSAESTIDKLTSAASLFGLAAVELLGK
jgi:hypothetical protein